MRRIGPRAVGTASHLRAASSGDSVARRAVRDSPRRGILHTFSELLAGKTAAEQVVDELAAFACGTWGWGRPLLLRRDGRDGSFSLAATSKRAGAMVFAADHALIAALVQRQCATCVEEFEEARRIGDAEAGATCREYEWDVCVPLVVDGIIQLVLAFPLRERGQPSPADLEILDGLAALSSAAILRVRMANDLQLAQEAIRRAERLSSLGTLSASVAHEIRNQMVAIQTFLQLLPERLDDEEFLTSFLALASDEAKRIASLVGELLTFARSTDRGDSRECINELVERTVTILQAEAKKGQVCLHLDLALDLPNFFGNGDKIRQVLTNLLLNAIQATPPQGNVSVTTRVLRLGDVERLQIEIRDSGPGIAREELDQVFAPFFTTKAQGTGLGLAISRSIVREHGGDVSVQSNQGAGATFFIELPVLPSGTVGSL